MADETDAMREFRLLDAKRCAARLTSAEEARWCELRDQLRAETAAPQAHFARPAAFGKPVAVLEWAAWTRLPPANLPPAGFDFNAQAHWAADGTWFPPGLDPITRQWLDPAYEDAWRQGFVWDRATQGWAALPDTEIAAPQAEAVVVEETASTEAAATADPSSDTDPSRPPEATLSAPEEGVRVAVEAAADPNGSTESVLAAQPQTGTWGEFLPDAVAAVRAAEPVAPAWEYAEKTPASGWVVREAHAPATSNPEPAEAAIEAMAQLAPDSDLVEEPPGPNGGEEATGPSGVEGHGAEEWQIVHGPAQASASYGPTPAPSFASRSGEWSVEQPVPLPGPTSDMIAAAIPEEDLAQPLPSNALEAADHGLVASSAPAEPDWNETTDELPAAGPGEEAAPQERIEVESSFDWQAPPAHAPAEEPVPAADADAPADDLLDWNVASQDPGAPAAEAMPEATLESPPEGPVEASVEIAEPEPSDELAAGEEPRVSEWLESGRAPAGFGEPEPLEQTAADWLESTQDVATTDGGAADELVETLESADELIEPAVEECLDSAERPNSDWLVSGPAFAELPAPFEEANPAEESAPTDPIAEPRPGEEAAEVAWADQPDLTQALEGEPTAELGAAPDGAEEVPPAGLLEDAGELVEYVELPGPDTGESHPAASASTERAEPAERVPVLDGGSNDPFVAAPDQLGDSLLSMDWSVLPGTERVPDQSGADLLPVEPVATPELQWEADGSAEAPTVSPALPLAGAAEYVTWDSPEDRGEAPIIEVAQPEPAFHADGQAVAVSFAPLPDERIESTEPAPSAALPMPEIELAADFVETAAEATPEIVAASLEVDLEQSAAEATDAAPAVSLEFELGDVAPVDRGVNEPVTEAPVLELALEDVVVSVGAEAPWASAAEPRADANPFQAQLEQPLASEPAPNMPTIDLILGDAGDAPSDTEVAVPTSVDIPVETFESGEVPAFAGESTASADAEQDGSRPAAESYELQAFDEALPVEGSAPSVEWSDASPTDSTSAIPAGDAVGWEPAAEAVAPEVPWANAVEPAPHAEAEGWQLPHAPEHAEANAAGVEPKAFGAGRQAAAAAEAPVNAADPDRSEPELMVVDDTDILPAEARPQAAVVSSPSPAPMSAPVAMPAPIPAAVPVSMPASAPAAMPAPARAGWIAPQPPNASAAPFAAPVSAGDAPSWLSGAPAPALSLSASAVVSGERRVIVHTLEGGVIRGVLRDANLLAPTVSLVSVPGGAVERLETDRLKAVFVLSAPGAHPPPGEGQKLRITFHDERQLTGFAGDYSPDARGFFITPAETRSLAERVFVYQAGIKTIALG